MLALYVACLGKSMWLVSSLHRLASPVFPAAQHAICPPPSNTLLRANLPNCCHPLYSHPSNEQGAQDGQAVSQRVGQRKYGFHEGRHPASELSVHELMTKWGYEWPPPPPIGSRAMSAAGAMAGGLLRLLPGSNKREKLDKLDGMLKQAGKEALKVQETGELQQGEEGAAKAQGADELKKAEEGALKVQQTAALKRAKEGALKVQTSPISPIFPKRKEKARAVGSKGQVRHDIPGDRGTNPSFGTSGPWRKQAKYTENKNAIEANYGPKWKIVGTWLSNGDFSCLTNGWCCTTPRPFTVCLGCDRVLETFFRFG